MTLQEKQELSKKLKNELNLQFEVKILNSNN